MRAHIDRAYAVEADPLFTEVLNRIRRTQIPLDINQVFLLSFSPDGDEIGMWGLYANRKSGFSFSFSPTEISTVQNALILPCKYDPQELHDFCIRCLVGLRNIVLADSAAGTAQDPQYYADDFLRHGVWFTAVFKPQIWSDEQEWRMVITRPGTHHQHLKDGRHYITIPGPGDNFDRFPIRAICLGAECDRATGAEISAAVQAAGLGVPIYHSKFGRHASFPITGGVTANPTVGGPAG
jgi:hypothetical protein